MTSGLALHQLLIWSLSVTDAWDGHPADGSMERFLGRLVTDAEGAAVGDALGRAAFALARDPDHFDLVAEMIVRFDAYEAVAGLRPLIEAGHSDATVAGAALASHPGAEPGFKELLLDRADDLPEALRDLVLVRVDPTHLPATAPARVDRRVRWFEADRAEGSVPVVGIQADAGPPREVWNLVFTLRSAGIIVRRIPQQPWQSAEPGWLPHWAPRLGNVQQERDRPWIPTGGLLSAAKKRNAMQAVRHTFPHLEPSWAVDTQSVAPTSLVVETAEEFHSGAIPTHEMRFFAGLRTGTLRSASKKYEPLAPRGRSGLNHWTFSQLVALRTANYLAQTVKAVGHKVSIGALASSVVELSRQHGEVPIGVTSDGRVVVERDGQTVDIRDGQTVMGEVLRLADTVYRPFKLSNAKVAAIPQPTRSTRLHPAVAGGLPFVDATRVTVRAVGQVAVDAGSTGSGNVAQAVLDSFPELGSEARVKDAIRLHNRILAS